MSSIRNLVFVATASAFVLFLNQQPLRSPPLVIDTRFLAFLLGVFFLPITKRILPFILRANGGKRRVDESKSYLYGLNHGRLNLELPPAMWMNMGYWHKKGNRCPTLSEASKALIDEVFRTASLTQRTTVQNRTFALVDLGFGCGDQTLVLTGRPSPLLPHIQSYVGITLDEKQHQYAEERIRQPLSTNGSGHPCRIKLFCGDAARPEKWKDRIEKEVFTSIAQADETLVLALDTLYHFSPSRWPVIHYACNRLQASFMAFDLCLSENVSFRTRLVLRTVTALMGAPWANFVTTNQYRANLLAAGYTEVIIRDISEHVFGPLADFLEEQDRRLQVIGYSLGAFRAAKWMFRWWADSGAIRGVIVVAKRQ